MGHPRLLGLKCMQCARWASTAALLIPPIWEVSPEAQMASTQDWNMGYVVHMPAPRVLAGDLRDGQMGWRYREYGTEMRQSLDPEVHQFV